MYKIVINQNKSHLQIIILLHLLNMSFCFVFQLHFIRCYLAEQRRFSDITKDQTQIEEDMIIEANRYVLPCTCYDD